MAISYASLTGGGKIQKTEIIKSTQSWTVPADVSEVEVLLCGGGGSGVINVAYVCGGGGGSVDYGVFGVTPGETFTITIGAGAPGAKGLVSAFGANGNPSSFGSYFSVDGGGGGGKIYPLSTSNFIRGTGGAGSGRGGKGGNGNDDRHDGAALDGGIGFMGFGSGGGGSGRNEWQLGNGSGGSGNGGAYGFVPTNAKPNTGGGGGGHSCNSNDPTGAGDGGAGNGGSGVCVIKYWTAG